jgi:hypothetical protein
MQLRGANFLRRFCQSDSPPTSCAGSDAVLLDRFRQGHDEGAFAALVARHGPLVLRLLAAAGVDLESLGLWPER